AGEERGKQRVVRQRDRARRDALRNEVDGEEGDPHREDEANGGTADGPDERARRRCTGQAAGLPSVPLGGGVGVAGGHAAPHVLVAVERAVVLVHLRPPRPGRRWWRGGACGSRRAARARRAGRRRPKRAPWWRGRAAATGRRPAARSRRRR